MWGLLSGALSSPGVAQSVPHLLRDSLGWDRRSGVPRQPLEQGQHPVPQERGIPWDQCPQPWHGAPWAVLAGGRLGGSHRDPLPKILVIHGQAGLGSTCGAPRAAGAEPRGGIRAGDGAGNIPGDTWTMGKVSTHSQSWGN